MEFPLYSSTFIENQLSVKKDYQGYSIRNLNHYQILFLYTDAKSPGQYIEIYDNLKQSRGNYTYLNQIMNIPLT
jgi:hypothetical protein